MSRPPFKSHAHKVAGAVLALLGLLFLVGCQGLSVGSSQPPPPTGSLTFSGTSVDFGTVPVGSSKTLTFTATNGENQTVTVGSAAITTQYFSLVATGLPMSIDAGQTATFSIKFTPKAVTSYTAQINISSSATDATATLDLTGTGSSGSLSASPAGADFGNVVVGSSQQQTIALTNNGSSDVNISLVSASGAGYQVSGITTPLTLSPSQSTNLTVTFTPQATGTANGTLSISSNDTNSPLNLPLTGVGVTLGSLGVSPTSLSFGNVVVGGKSTLTQTITNTGGSSVTISQISASGSGFSVSGITTPVTLGAGQSATFSVSFSPAAAGSATGSVTITSTASNPTVTIPLSGTGVAPGNLGANPTSLSFGSVQVGSNSTLSETVTNTGASTVTISQVSVSGSGFSVSGITAPVTLTAGQSATFSVKFAPASAGAASGSITVTSDASNPTLTIPLSGTGLAAGALSSNPTSLSFGSVVVGNSTNLSETVTNTGGSTVTISQVSVSGSAYSVSGITAPVTLTAGQSATFSVKFAPASAGSASGSITITSDASNPSLTIPLSGTGVTAGALSANPTSLSFGSVVVGNSTNLSETVTNTGGTSVTISQVSVSGSGFSVSGITAPVTLTAGQSATFSVKFAPASAGAASGSITITSNASNPTLTIGLDGIGVTAGALTANPTSLSFGNVQVGNNSTLSETVTNTGGSSVTISQASVSGSGFSISGITAPVTLTAGQSATFSVKFAPASAAAASGSITITSNASNPTLTIPLSGTGVAAGALSANPTSLSFGNVQVGNNSTLSETVTNTGGSTVTISQVSVSGGGFSISGITAPVTLTAGQSATFSVKFAPASAGAASGSVTITSNASNPTLTIPLSGTGVTPGALSANPASLSFGSVQVGSNSSLSETVTNTGGSTVTISQVSVSGSAFSISGITAPVTLTAGQSATFSVTFAPSAAGSASGSVTITSNASNPTLTIPLSGTGTSATGTLAVSPVTLAFGNVVTGSSSTLTGTLTASGAAVTVTAATTNNSVFSVGGLSLPVTIPAGNSVPFSVTFSPLVAGSVSATLTFTSNASPSTTVQNLTGTGTAASSHSVDLSWNASTSSNIAGYNVYRAPYVSNKCGSYSALNLFGLVTSTLYTDSTVANSTSYCYAATAVDASNNESAYSNIVSNVQIP